MPYIAHVTGHDKEVVHEVVKLVLEQLYERIMNGEAVLLPVGILEPRFEKGVRYNINKKREEPRGKVLKLRTTRRFRKRFKNT